MADFSNVTHRDDFVILLRAELDKRASERDVEKKLRDLHKKIEQRGLNKIKLVIQLDTRKLDKLSDRIRRLTSTTRVIKFRTEVNDKQLTNLINKINRLDKLSKVIKIGVELGKAKQDLKHIDDIIKRKRQMTVEIKAIEGKDGVVIKNVIAEQKGINRIDNTQQVLQNTSKQIAEYRSIGVIAREAMSNHEQLKKVLAETYSNMEQGHVVVRQIKSEINNLGQEILKYTVSVRKGNHETQEFKGVIDKTTGVIREQKRALKDNSEEFATMSRRLQTALQTAPVWMAAMTAIYGPLRGLQDMLAVITEIDAQLTEMKRVMDEPTNMDEILRENIELANELGQSLTAVNEAYMGFARQGFDQQQALDLTKAALVAANVSDLTAEEAMNNITAAIVQFNKEASDAIRIVDAWNEVDNQFAITTKDISTAMARAGATAQTFGVEMEEMIGHITAIGVATRESGSVIGKFIAA